MKTLLLGLFLLGSVSSYAKVCQLEPVLNLDSERIILYMEDKAEATPNKDITIALMGGNPNNLDCESLIKEIKESGRKTVELEGQKIKLQIVHTINL